jgi:signal transduction histidine kinase
MTTWQGPAAIGRAILWPAGLAMGLVALWFAALEPVFSFMARSPITAIVGLGAGWMAIAVGVMSWRRQPDNGAGPLLAAAGFAWFAVEWANPASGSSTAFTVGLVLSAACPPLVCHAVLSYPRGRLESVGEKVVVGLAYVTNLVGLGLVSNLVYDPARERCAFCPANLVAVTSDPAIYAMAARVGLASMVAWTGLAVLLIARSLGRSSPTRRRVIAPVLVPGAFFEAFAAADVAYRLRPGSAAIDEVELGLWILEAAALVGIALGVAFEWARASRTRVEVARLVVELGESPAPGALREVLSSVLADPELELAYPIGDGRFVDAEGQRVDVSLRPGRTVTPLVRSEEVLAIIDHRDELLDDPARVEDVVVASRLALESERLRAELRAQLEDLRASRVRVVEAADAERRRLERNLHDGAQQRLVSLSMALRLVRRALESASDPSMIKRADEANDELRAALAELRDLAHGIYPAVLTDEGLAAAVEALRETSTIAIDLGELPEGRMDPRVEAAAYFVVAEMAMRTTAGKIRVMIRRLADRLVVEVQKEGPPPDTIADLEDRTGAMDGSVAIEAEGGLITIRAEIPCAS